MEDNRFQLSIIITKSFILDVGKGFGLAKLISIQKLFMTETALNGNYKITYTITGSKIELFATVVT